MAQITIEKLYEKLLEQINAADDIDVFYIGKAKDVQQRAEEHKKDNLPITITLASGKESIILEAEKFLQEKFQNDNRCINKQKGGGPNVEPTDNIYISYRKINPILESINDLDFEEFEWKTIYTLK